MTRPQLLFLALASAAVAVLGLGVVDAPLARFVAAHGEAVVWEPTVAVLEYVVGIEPLHLAVPVILALGAIVTTVVPKLHAQSRRWIYVALVYLIVRNATMWIKLFSGRLRPHQWVPVGGPMFGHVGDGASFPSGHIALFGGLLIPLAVAVPRLRPVVWIVPFVMAARIAVQAHFLSDVCAGLTLVSSVAWLLAPVLRDSARPPAVPTGDSSTPALARSGDRA